MCVLSYDMIAARELFLKAGVRSDDVVVSDGNADIHFTFLLEYVDNDAEGKTKIDVKDAYNADITIQTKPNSETKLNVPYSLGTYKDGDLLFNFVVNPCFGGDTHKVVVTFYTNKPQE